jgi:hypothetical protein
MSFSSGELTVIVQTVCLSALASKATDTKKNAASKANFTATDMDDGQWANWAR